jgi:hypothetical protein
MTEHSLSPPLPTKGGNPWRVFGIVGLSLLVVAAAVGVGLAIGSSGNESSETQNDTVSSTPTGEVLTTAATAPTTATVKLIDLVQANARGSDVKLVDALRLNEPKLYEEKIALYGGQDSPDLDMATRIQIRKLKEEAGNRVATLAVHAIDVCRLVRAGVALEALPSHRGAPDNADVLYSDLTLDEHARVDLLMARMFCNEDIPR